MSSRPEGLQGEPCGAPGPATGPEASSGEAQAPTMVAKFSVTLSGPELESLNTHFDSLQRLGAEEEEENIKGRQSHLVQLETVGSDGEKGVCYIQREAMAKYPLLMKTVDEEQKEADSPAILKFPCSKSALRHFAVYLMAKLLFPTKSYLANEEGDLTVVLDVLHLAHLYNV